MKNIKRVLLLFFTILIVQPVAAWTEMAMLDPEPRFRNLFVVKTEKNMVGGKVEVLKANGDLVTAQTLNKRKMIIDFRDVKYGSYTIRVSKGREVEEFTYVKK